MVGRDDFFDSARHVVRHFFATLNIECKEEMFFKGLDAKGVVKGKKDLPKEGDTINKEGTLWSPATVIKNPRCDGLQIKLNAPAVPFEASPDDPRLWENILTK